VIEFPLHKWAPQQWRQIPLGTLNAVAETAVFFAFSHDGYRRITDFKHQVLSQYTAGQIAGDFNLAVFMLQCFAVSTKLQLKCCYIKIPIPPRQHDTNAAKKKTGLDD